MTLARGGLALLRGGAEVTEVTEPALAGGPRELDGGSLGDDLAACPVNSFVGGTKVLMADGSLKPIAEVRIGDKLRSIDPTTGRVVIGVVTGTYRNQDHEFADLTLIGLDGQTRHLLTTQHHRFWDETRQGWVFAVDLAHGDQLEEADGSLVKLWDVVVSRGTSMMYDLTVDSTHTFYVLAGSASILVHNCGGSEITFSESQLAAKSKHATDFGAQSQKPEDFLSAMSDHLDSPTAQKIQGWYGRSSNRIQAVHYYDPATRLNIITDTNGAFISGWRLGEVQAASLEMTGGFW